MKTIILAGNPNVGKSVLFKNLTGHYVTVSNYPGTTVELTRAQSNFDPDIQVVDSPGINDLSSSAEDSRVTQNLLKEEKETVLIQVADAKNLRRSLLLTFQLAESGLPMILALNMSDELKQRGGTIDVQKLSDLLGIPVIPTVAIRNEGITELIQSIPHASLPSWDAPDDLRKKNADLYQKNCERLDWISSILEKTCFYIAPPKPSIGVRLGFWAIHPVKGLLILLFILWMMFWFVGLFGAGTLVDFFETALFKQKLNPFFISLADRCLPFPHEHSEELSVYHLTIPITPVHSKELGQIKRTVLSTEYKCNAPLTPSQRTFLFIHDLLVGPYGLLTMGLSYALAIVFPIVLTFFLLFGFLEDTGYLPRLAIMLNRLFRSMGLNGKAVLPMIMGLGCDTMATLTTRILETRRERIITTFILALVVPCSAQLGVIMAMLSRLSIWAAMIWIGLIMGVMLLAGRLSAMLIRGKSSDFILEIPAIRRPQVVNLLSKTFSRLEWYLKEVIPLFFLGTAMLFLFDWFHILEKIANLMHPIVTNWLGLPKQMANAFLIGFLRRDFGAVYLLKAATGREPLLDPHQIFVSIVTITFFLPCIATFFMIAKEHGKKIAVSIGMFTLVFAFLSGGLINHIGKWLGL
ncbi:MAG: ferrous iron transporter B [Candidatus Aureabacteria bacterium]|nr:ferrous iron transporter B [Candidatus Auribacterota bacterium]